MKRWTALLTAICLALSATPQCAAIPESAQQGKLIALTFDDGPGRYTGHLLDALAERGVKATFFVLGCNAEARPDLVRRAYQQGHQIANHTYSHCVLTGQSDEKIREEVTKTTTLLNEICGAELTYLLRPPCGESDKRVLSIVDCPAITWSIDPADWRDQSADTVKRRIVEAAYDGAVILAHDLYDTTVRGVTAAVEELQKEGYEFVTVNELFRRRGISLENGHVYCRCRQTGTQLPAMRVPEITVQSTQGGVCVTICADEGAAIYYTTDGSDPTSDSAVYSAPLTLSSGCTVKAVAAFNFNGSRSDIAVREIPS